MATAQKRCETWLDQKDAAWYLGTPRKWLSMHTGSRFGLPGTRHGRRMWYRLSDLQRWLESTERLVQSGLLTRRQVAKLALSWVVRPPKACR
jgi:hypothetical protein